MAKTIRKERKFDKPRKKYKRKATPLMAYFEPVTVEEVAEFNKLSRMLMQEELELGYYTNYR